MDGAMYFGGIEGGATHSNLVICDANGKVVGRAKGPGTNHWNLGMEECTKRISAMLQEGKKDAGIPADRILDSLGLTLSGCEQESSNAELAKRVRDKERCAKEVFVGSDTAGSLATGAPDEGMVLIAGTGSNALLRTADGQQYGCGGWGYMLGDEGGAYWIAHRAVKTIFDDVDGLRPSPHPTDRVWEVIREHFQADTRADILPHAYKHFDKSHFAGLTSKLSHLAAQGNALSLQLFADAGSILADHIVALSRHTTARRIRVVCVGSVWKAWDAMKPGMLAELIERKVKAELEFIHLRVSSAMGAAWLAAKHVNYELPRDDSAFCEVFYTFYPDRVNGTNGMNETNGVNELNGMNGMNGMNGKMNGKIENGTDSGYGDCRS